MVLDVMVAGSRFVVRGVVFVERGLRTAQGSRYFQAIVEELVHVITGYGRVLPEEVAARVNGACEGV